MELANVWKEKRPEDRFVPCIVGESECDESFWTFPDPTMNTCDAATAERYAARYAPHQCRVEQRSSRSARSIWAETFGEDASPPDFVNIDVEGHEIPIINGLVNESWKPALLVVEAKLFCFTTPREQPVVKLLLDFGYVLVAKTPLDAFFIDPNNQVFQWLPEAMKRI